MSKHINQSGNTTYFTLNDVATSVLAAAPGIYTLAVWSNGPTAIASKIVVACSTTAALNTALSAYYYPAGGQLVYLTIASGTGAQDVVSWTTNVWQLYTFVFTTTVGIAGYDQLKISVNGGTFSSKVINAATSVAIDNLTLGARVYNSAAAALHASNWKFAYFGLWSGIMSQANATKLATYAPSLVNTGNLIFATDANLNYAAGSSNTEFVTVGSDVAISDDNPLLITGESILRRKLSLGAYRDGNRVSAARPLPIGGGRR